MSLRFNLKNTLATPVSRIKRNGTIDVKVPDLPSINKINLNFASAQNSGYLAAILVGIPQVSTAFRIDFSKPKNSGYLAILGMLGDIPKANYVFDFSKPKNSGQLASLGVIVDLVQI